MAFVKNTFLCFPLAEGDERRAQSVPASARLARRGTRELAGKKVSSTGIDESVATTVMLKNLPVDSDVVSVCELLVKSGFEGTFDYAYMPMGWRHVHPGEKPELQSFGFAVVNFTASASALSLMKMYPPRGRKSFHVVCARLQGVEANIDDFYNRASKRSGDDTTTTIDACRPWLFVNHNGGTTPQPLPQTRRSGLADREPRAAQC
mmetsp:Transcript_10519/g.26728  ORF Transcript_10519/g.26728 Transcript_10519/m.26728 type:complete len:206 (-) Transcript_10519:211-828(-)